MAKTTQSNATQAVIASLVREEFSAFQAYDDACTDRDGTLIALVAAIGYESGKPATEDHVAEFKAIATEYQAAWVAVAKCDVLSAGRQWQRVVTRAGIVKPQTAKAIKAQELRTAQKAADKVNPKGKAAPVPAMPAAPTSGAVYAGDIKAALVHLDALVKAGKFTAAHDWLREIEKKSKTNA